MNNKELELIKKALETQKIVKVSLGESKSRNEIGYSDTIDIETETHTIIFILSNCWIIGKKPKKYRVLENQLTLLIETNNRHDAVRIMNSAHLEKKDRFHELFEYWNNQYNGIRQYKPNDNIIESV